MAGTTRRIAGKAKEVEGKATGDRLRETLGKVEQAHGRLEKKAKEIKETVAGARRQARGELTSDETESLEGRAQRKTARQRP